MAIEWIPHTGNTQPPLTRREVVIYRVLVGKMFPRKQAFHPHWADDLNWRTSGPNAPLIGKIVDYAIVKKRRRSYGF